MLYDKFIDDIKDVFDSNLIDYYDYNHKISTSAKDFMNALNKSSYDFIFIKEIENGVLVEIENEDEAIIYSKEYREDTKPKSIIYDIYEYFLKKELNNLEKLRSNS